MPNDRSNEAPRVVIELRGVPAADPAGLRRVRIRAQETGLEVEWWDGTAEPAEPAATPLSLVDTPRAESAAAAAPDEDQDVVVSPMVGTFYRAPSPGADPFVKVGDAIEVGQVVGIVEAMKLLNTITTEAAGVVVEILADDATPVEFGQPLIAMRPGA